MNRTDAIFDPLAASLMSCGVQHGPSELHGVICGLLSTGAGGVDEELLGVLAAHAELAGDWPLDVAEALLALRDLGREGMAEETMDLVLLLPDDSDELGNRVAALGQWCEGFLVGFGTGSAGTRDAELPPGLQEALSDLAAVSQVALPDDSGDDEERMLEEIIEHCRVAALTVFTELALAGQARDKRDKQKDKQKQPPVTH